MGLVRCCGVWLVLLGLLYPGSRAYAQSAETAAQTAQAWFQRGVSLSRAAQWSDARAAYLRSIDLEPRVSTYFKASLCPTISSKPLTSEISSFR